MSKEKEIVREIMYRERISQEELGIKIGCSRANISDYLRRGESMRVDRLKEMCEVLGAELIIRKGSEEYKI